MSTWMWEDFDLPEGWGPEGRGREEEGEGVLFLGMRWTFWRSSMDDTLPKCSLERGGGREGGRREGVGGRVMVYYH